MGFLEDLVKTIQESADEARAQQRQRKSSPEWAPLPKTAERQTARVVRRMREDAPAPETPAAQPHHAAVDAPQQARPDPHQHWTARARKLLHQPRTLRELMLFKEILDRPLALRRQRGWPR